MARAREIADLQLRDHKIQIFADISPATIQKSRAMKPLLQPLIATNIKYYWAFPFQLNFTFHNKKHSFSMFPKGEVMLKKLGIISMDPERPLCTPIPRSPTTKPVRSPPSPVWRSTKSQARLRSRPPMIEKEYKGCFWVGWDLVE